MAPSREQIFRALAVSALFAGPLLCAALYFRLQAPGHDPGVYLQTHDGSAYALSATPLVPAALGKDPRRAFVIVGTPDSPLVANAPSARLWCFVVDAADARVHAEAVPIPATIRQINPRTLSVADKINGALIDSVAAANPRAYRITSDELAKAWTPESVPFQQYHRALAGTASPRPMDVLIGLEVQDSANGPRRMYSVRMGPPR
jgi:hypothetical protein